MKTKYSISLLLNVILITCIVICLIQKGGLTYLKKTINTSKPIEKEKINWYYKNNIQWKEAKSLYEILPNDSNEIVFLGNSLIQCGNWSELLSNPKIKNRGIGGDNTEGILHRLSEVTESAPSKIFINIGTNDLALNIRISEIIKNYEQIINDIQHSSPKTKIYLQSILPVKDRRAIPIPKKLRCNDSIQVLNKEINNLSKKYSLTYIDLYDHFIDENGDLNMIYSFDALHLNGKGYLLWSSLIKNHVNH